MAHFAEGAPVIEFYAPANTLSAVLMVNYTAAALTMVCKKCAASAFCSIIGVLPVYYYFQKFLIFRHHPLPLS